MGEKEVTKLTGGERDNRFEGGELSNIKMCKLTGKQHLERRCTTSDDLTETEGTVQV